MKNCKISVFLLLMIVDVSTNAQEITCEEEQLVNVNILIGHPGVVSPYKPGHVLVFQCTGANMNMYGQRAIECQSNGKWDHPYPQCKGKCGPPPPVNNADTILMTDKKYNSGEHVIYKCFDKYILDERPPKSDTKTCQDGEWKGDIYCLKPCTVTEEIMNERGLKHRWSNDKKLFCKHDEFAEFACKDKGKSKMTGKARIQCNDGEFTLPKCV